MALVNTITDEYYFYEWLKRSDNYKNNFTLEGARALQEYYDNLSDELNENIEFDPIAWICEFSEYKNFKEFKNDSGIKNIKSIKDLYDYTTVIEFEGGILVQNF